MHGIYLHGRTNEQEGQGSCFVQPRRQFVSRLGRHIRRDLAQKFAITCRVRGKVPRLSGTSAPLDHIITHPLVLPRLTLCSLPSPHLPARNVRTYDGKKSKATLEVEWRTSAIPVPIVPSEARATKLYKLISPAREFAEQVTRREFLRARVPKSSRDQRFYEAMREMRDIRSRGQPPIDLDKLDYFFRKRKFAAWNAIRRALMGRGPIGTT